MCISKIKGVVTMVLAAGLVFGSTGIGVGLANRRTEATSEASPRRPRAAKSETVVVVLGDRGKRPEKSSAPSPAPVPPEGSDAKDDEPDVFKVNAREIALCLNTPADVRATLKEIRWFASIDQGKTWKIVGSRPPSSVEFRYIASANGLYWFRVQLIKKDGTVAPLYPHQTANERERELKPDVKVRVSTKASASRGKPTATRTGKAAILGVAARVSVGKSLIVDSEEAIYYLTTGEEKKTDPTYRLTKETRVIRGESGKNAGLREVRDGDRLLVEVDENGKDVARITIVSSIRSKAPR